MQCAKVTDAMMQPFSSDQLELTRAHRLEMTCLPIYHVKYSVRNSLDTFSVLGMSCFFEIIGITKFGTMHFAGMVPIVPY